MVLTSQKTFNLPYNVTNERMEIYVTPPITLREHTLQRKGYPIHYWESGMEGAPLVVFTHGLCVDHRSWDATIPAVALKYRVLEWDVRGHGLSQPVSEPFSVPLAVEDLMALMDELACQKAVLVGHSNGTYISQELLFRYPQRVIGLVVADGTCITWEHSAFENWLVRNSWKTMAWFPYETLKKSPLPYASAGKEVQEYTYAAYSMLSKLAFIEINKGMALTGLHAEPGYRIQAPMLLVHGDGDKMGDIAKIAPLWAAREPDCRYEVIPNARHFAILDNPQVFNRLLLEFLEKVAPVA